MARSDYFTLLTGSTAVNKSGLLTALEARGVYVIADGENPQSYDSGNSVGLFYTGILFWRDNTDSTTAHDGVTCIVTNDGVRFKTDYFAGHPMRFIAVLDKDLTAPPGSPVVGDAYIVAAGGTGAWATHDKQIASWTARGWRFIIPVKYDHAFVVDELLFYHYNASNVWTSGLPGLVIANDSISPQKRKYGKFGLKITNQTTNTPPGTPADGDAYIIGGTPTGVWAGNAKNIAIFETSAWVIYTAQAGYLVFDQSLNQAVLFNAGIWNSLVSGISNVATAISTTASGVLSRTNASPYAFSETVAPTTANQHWEDPFTITYTALRSGSIIELNYQCLIATSTFNIGNAVAALFRDSDATALDWLRVSDIALIAADSKLVNISLFFTTVDTSSHTYKVWIVPSNANTAGVNYLNRRRFLLKEYA